MKNALFYLLLLALTLFVVLSACENNTDVIIYNNGKTSNGSRFVGIDKDNFYLDKIKYTVDDFYLKVSGFESMGIVNKKAKIASSVHYNGNSYKVLEIGERAFYDCIGLTSITIPNSVSIIWNGTFSGCGRLSSIIINKNNPYYDSRKNCNAIIESKSNRLIAGCQTTIIPNSVTAIGKSAFSGSDITSITIPNCVENIGDSAFANCRSLTSVAIPNSVTAIGENAFYGCKKLESVTIPDGVSLIEKRSFSGCKSLSSVTIPNSVKRINYEAFEGCNNYSMFISDIGNWCKNEIKSPFESHHLYLNGEEIINLVIPKTVTSISDNAFSGCDSFVSLDLPDSIKMIGSKAFFDCSSLGSVVIPNSVVEIGYKAFSGCKSISSIILGSGLISIGEYAFEGCNYLSSMMIPLGIKHISKGTFYGCNGLSSIKIPNSVMSIESNAFSGCKNLKGVSLPSNVTYIGDYAFAFCSGLESVSIPDSVTFIGSGAFYGCSGLSSVYCKGATPPNGFSISYPWFDSNTFDNVMLYVPKGSIDSYKKAEGWKQFAHIKEEE